jgi:acetyl esterase
MVKRRGTVVLIFALAGCLMALSLAASDPTEQPPQTFVYREIDGQKLNAFVFQPAGPETRKPAPAILLFHGGGWQAGSAEWTFASARRFAGLGMVAISVDYRLSEGKVTPVDALDDTCAAFRWVREHARELKVDTHRVAGDGVSAGGQLVAAAATVGCPGIQGKGASCRPDLLLLWSPALDVAADGWFRKLLQGRANPSDLSPLEHVGASTPPTCIVQGEKDTLTPLSGAQRFSDLMAKSSRVCKLIVYPGVGHLLTRNLANQESDFDPDPQMRADGNAQQERFLKEQGYLPGK